MRNVKMTIWVFAMSACVYALPVFGLTQFKDGTTHNIATTISDEVWVDYEAPGIETTVNFLDGALVTYSHPVIGFENSVINIFGGQIPGVVSAMDNVQINMMGGSIADIYGYDESYVNISSGTITWTLRGHDNSKIDISGGQTKAVWSGNNSEINFLGGTIEQASFNGNSSINFSDSILELNVISRDNSKIDISGGVIYGDLEIWNESQVVFTGGLIGGDLIAREASLITIYGTGFNYELGQITAPVGTLTGTLLNGDPINNSFLIYDDANIILVPEPATLLLLGLGSLILRKRKNAFCC